MISLALANGQRRVVHAHVRGDWAAHKTLTRGARGYCVTHVPSGHSTVNYCDDMSQRDAIAIAELLDSMDLEIPADVSTTPQETLSLISAAHAEVLGG